MIEVRYGCVDCKHRDDTPAPPTKRCSQCLESETSDGYWELCDSVEFPGSNKLEPLND